MGAWERLSSAAVRPNRGSVQAESCCAQDVSLPFHWELLPLTEQLVPVGPCYADYWLEDADTSLLTGKIPVKMQAVKAEQQLSAEAPSMLSELG